MRHKKNITLKQGWGLGAMALGLILSHVPVSAQTLSNLDSNGNVQFIVGGSPPQKFLADGTFQLPDTSSSSLCTADHVGAIRWNGSYQVFEGCSISSTNPLSYAWISLAGPGSNQTAQCDPGLVVTGLRDGVPVCSPVTSRPVFSCPADHVMTANNVCVPTASVVVTNSVPQGQTAQCDPGLVVIGMKNGAPICGPMTVNPLPTCTAGQALSYSNGVYSCVTVAVNVASCPKGQILTGVAKGEPLCAGLDSVADVGGLLASAAKRHSLDPGKQEKVTEKLCFPLFLAFDEHRARPVCAASEPDASGMITLSNKGNAVCRFVCW